MCLNKPIRKYHHFVDTLYDNPFVTSVWFWYGVWQHFIFLSAWHLSPMQIWRELDILPEDWFGNLEFSSEWVSSRPEKAESTSQPEIRYNSFTGLIRLNMNLNRLHEELFHMVDMVKSTCLIPNLILICNFDLKGNIKYLPIFWSQCPICLQQSGIQTRLISAKQNPDNCC